ncbi:MAG: glycogen/starch/alpha-glucan phosphorylase [Ignavibacteriae bacterium]|nr:MAG: glycogen/starch/alpha-glucan phosphorylase [Ignavibacteriota bacterium]
MYKNKSNVHSGMSINMENLKKSFSEHLENDLVKDFSSATEADLLKALILSVRRRLTRNWIDTQKKYNESNSKKVFYLSLEYLTGNLLGNALLNLGLYDAYKETFRQMGIDLEKIIDLEPDMGLGNGGLGRLAACFLDSLATLEYPAYGYGILYNYGIFEQDIENGYQIEKPDNWLKYGNLWEVVRPELSFTIKFGGYVESHTNEDGKLLVNWKDSEDVLAVAYDIPIPGYHNNNVNTLRLWSARSTNEFNLKYFNQGDYFSAVEDKTESEVISKVLYPNDSIPAGKILRFKQQYFFVSATLQDIIQNFRKYNSDFSIFPDKVTIHLNDTHPAIAIPELMRLLMDEQGLEWNAAWEITKKTFAYTNHTILPEALEEWPASLIAALLPRHYRIIDEINHIFLEDVRKNFSADNNVIARMSIFGENGEKKVRMSHLAIVGSYSVNGVAELHTEILKKYVFPDFDKYYKNKINNKTNGITPRRFLLHANPGLSELITSRIGDSWVTNLTELKNIEQFVNDNEFLEDWRKVKQQNKLRLKEFIKQNYKVEINTGSLIDSHVKRFHEYKRQLLNVLHVITLYNRIKENPNADILPRTIILSGKAAPSYYMAKLVIKLINSIGDVVNNDKEIGDKLKVLFLKNYSVSLAEIIIPASELSEQISTAGYEASGTGNMKFALNGALTIGTLDGANIEIKDEVGNENIFIFGLKSDEVRELKSRGYRPRDYYERCEKLMKVIDMLSTDYFNKNEPRIFLPIVDDLLNHDPYLVLADYESYLESQSAVEAQYADKDMWFKKSIINTARSGKFSSDRTIRQYAEDIWHIKPVRNE